MKSIIFAHGRRATFWLAGIGLALMASPLLAASGGYVQGGPSTAATVSTGGYTVTYDPATSYTPTVTSTPQTTTAAQTAATSDDAAAVATGPSADLFLKTGLGDAAVVTFGAGDELEVGLTLTGVEGELVDVYLVLVLPDGSTRSFGTNLILGLPNKVAPLVGGWAAQDLEAVPVVNLVLPASLPVGDYVWHVVLTEPGKGVDDTANWLVHDEVKMIYMGEGGSALQ